MNKRQFLKSISALSFVSLLPFKGITKPIPKQKEVMYFNEVLGVFGHNTADKWIDSSYILHFRILPRNGICRWAWINPYTGKGRVSVGKGCPRVKLASYRFQTEYTKQKHMLPIVLEFEYEVDERENDESYLMRSNFLNPI